MISATRDDRHKVATAADQAFRTDQLGQYLFSEAPHKGSKPGAHDRMTRFDAEQARRYRESPAMLEEHGYRGGYSRSWTWGDSYHTEEGGALVLIVYEFASTDDALAFAERSARNACENTQNTFRPPGVGGAMGLSIRGYSAPVSEEVTFVRGPRWYMIDLQLAQHTDYREVVRFVAREDAVAR